MLAVVRRLASRLSFCTSTCFRTLILTHVISQPSNSLASTVRPQLLHFRCRLAFRLQLAIDFGARRSRLRFRPYIRGFLSVLILSTSSRTLRLRLQSFSSVLAIRTFTAIIVDLRFRSSTLRSIPDAISAVALRAHANSSRPCAYRQACGFESFSFAAIGAFTTEVSALFAFASINSGTRIVLRIFNLQFWPHMSLRFRLALPLVFSACVVDLGCNSLCGCLRFRLLPCRRELAVCLRLAFGIRISIAILLISSLTFQFQFQYFLPMPAICLRTLS
jgi:hypothetical protein